MASDATKLPAPVTIATIVATSAKTDKQLVASWVGSLNSDHTRRNFETTANRFLAALGKAIAWPWMKDRRFRKPVVRQLGHPCPRDPILLAASTQRAPP